MSSPGPTRTQGDLSEMLETLLDKGVVINADIAVTVGDTELLGIQIQAAVASFETAAKYGLAFPEGTNMEKVHEAAGVAHDGSTDTTNERRDHDSKNDRGHSTEERIKTADRNTDYSEESAESAEQSPDMTTANDSCRKEKK